MIDGELRRIEARGAGRLEGRGPELSELLLIRLHPLADIRRLLRAAFDIDEQGQIAADPDRVEMIEEEEPIPAEEILNVVLRRDHHGVHAGFVQESVEARAIKW